MFNDDRERSEDNEMIFMKRDFADREIKSKIHIYCFINKEY